MTWAAEEVVGMCVPLGPMELYCRGEVVVFGEVALYVGFWKNWLLPPMFELSDMGGRKQVIDIKIKLSVILTFPGILQMSSPACGRTTPTP